MLEKEHAIIYIIYIYIYIYIYITCMNKSLRKLINLKLKPAVFLRMVFVFKLIVLLDMKPLCAI